MPSLDSKGLISRRILNEPDYYIGKFFFTLFSSDDRIYA